MVRQHQDGVRPAHVTAGTASCVPGAIAPQITTSENGLLMTEPLQTTSTPADPDYPVFLDLTDRRVLVVGGGPVGTRRALGLRAAGAAVVVVSPTATDTLRESSIGSAPAGGHIVWRRRAFRADDVSPAWLVHAATGVPEVDDRVMAAAANAKVWAIRAADADRSPAWTATAVDVPSDADGVRIAVSGGRDPRRAAAIRDGIADAVRTGEIPLRRRRKPASDGGQVALVGAGPGDPDLITQRGRRLLRSADVVIADHLAPAALLADLDPDVEIRYAGKRPGHHSLGQDEINELIVSKAREGHRVVRLKGGDPFVLGRGGEEALACLAAGVRVEVVPGITSAVSVPAAAGIPVTHRGVTSSFLLVSGHAGVPGILEQTAAAPADATLVLLMGTRTLRQTASALIVRGRGADTPAAVIERGWTPQQRTVVGTLADIADIADRAGVVSPAVVVIGEVVGLRASLGDLASATATAGHTLPAHARDSRIATVDGTDTPGIETARIQTGAVPGDPAQPTPIETTVFPRSAAPQPTAVAASSGPAGPPRSTGTAGDRVLSVLL